MNRILAMLIVVSMLFTPAVIFAEEKKSDLGESGEVLTALGFLDAFAEQDLSPDDKLTRADFTIFIAKLMDIYTEEKITATSFSDVPADHPEAANIETASKRGVVNGYSDGTFRPDSEITQEQAVKFLIKALGYGVKAEQQGGFPQGYMVTGAENGLFKGLDMSIGKKLTYGEAVQLAYNALFIDVMAVTGFGTNKDYKKEDGKTLLSEKHGIHREYGQVKANEYSSLSGEMELNPGKVQIDDTVYTSDKIDFRDLLGYNIVFYYRENDYSDQDTIIFAKVDTRRNSELKLSMDTIESYDNNKYVYNTEGSKTKTATVSKKAEYIYNFKRVKNFEDIVYVPASGDVTLVDTDTDDVYDLVVIREYTNTVVDTVNLGEGFIYDKFSADDKIDLDSSQRELQYTIKSLDGKRLSLADINPLDVLSVLKSADNDVFDITVVKNTVQGKVTELGNTGEPNEVEITVNGQVYKSAPNYIAYGKAIMIGDEGIFHLDALGEIAYVEFTGIGYNAFGYLTRADIFQKGVEKRVQFRIFNSYGEFKSYKGADKITFDGDRGLAPEQVVERLSANQAVVPQVVEYELNDKGEIGLMSTKQRGAHEKEDSLQQIWNSSEKLEYKSSLKTFEARLCISNSTLLINLPTNLEDTEGFSIMTSQNLVNDKEYAIQAYALKTDTAVADIVIFTDAASSALSGDSPITIVTRIVSALNEDGERIQKLYGFSEGKEAEIIVPKDKEDLIKNIGIGDAMRYGINGKKELDSLELVFDASANQYKPAANPSSGAYYIAFYRVAYGRVYAKDGGFIRVAKDLNHTAASELEIYPADKFKIYKSKLVGGKVTVTTARVDDLVAYKQSGSDCSQVLIQTRYGDPKAIYIFENGGL